MTKYHSNSRRDFLGSLAHGLSGMALVDLLAADGLLKAAVTGDQPARDHVPRARRAIQIFLQGGLSHVDSFDYKPELIRHHGQDLPASELPDVFGTKIGLLHAPHWTFRQRGESGLWVSDLFPHMAQHADRLALIRSMHEASGNHTPATIIAQCGLNELGFPTLGAWLSYGLGSLSRDLPGFVVLGDPRGMPAGGSTLWGNGYLPAKHQGVLLKSEGPAVADLNSSQPVSAATRHARLVLLETMNREHLEARHANDELAARMRSYQLAARMQLAVPEAADLKRETAATHRLYGMDDETTHDFGRMCLLSRRLVERGVRYVQLWSGATLAQPTWDSHGDVPSDHAREAARIDLPVAGLLTDLQQRGLLDDTLVIFTTEFGRTPFAESEQGQLGKGRDHNQDGFTSWLAGGGVRGGVSYGATDPLGFRAVKNPVSVHDFHATILHLMGLDHEQLTFYHNGLERRLTNFHGYVIDEILA